MEEKQAHFRFIFWYVVGVSVGIMFYIVAVTFLPIPEKNSRFVDIAFGFLLNIFGTATAYLLGGNPAATKKGEEKVTIAGDAPPDGPGGTDPDKPRGPK